MTTTRPRRERHARPRATLALLILTASAVACGGDGPGSDPDGAASVPPAPAPPSDTAAPSGVAPGGAGDTAALEGPAGGPGVIVPDQEAADTGAWSMPPLRRTPTGSGRSTGILQSVRTGRHADYDRIVFEFSDHLPEYTIRYVQDPVACGSGAPVDPGGAAGLEVDLRPAAAHDDEGNATIAERTIRPGLPALRTARITCDFEAVVTWVLGIDRRAPVRTLELDSPPRLVVDVRHR